MNKHVKYLLILLLAAVSCESDDKTYEEYQVAEPIVLSKTALRAGVEVQSPQLIQQSGKIYVYEDILFVNDQGLGVHVIDNTDVSNPVAISFLKIPGNYDVAVRNDVLYADSGVDLVVFDIADINAITEISRAPDVFENASFPVTGDFDWIDYANLGADDVIVGYNIVTRRIEINPNEEFATDNATAGGASNTGQGGSLARFIAYDDYLYTLTSSELSTFNVSEIHQPVRVDQEQFTWNMETIFLKDGFIYVGTSSGIIVYDIANPANPTYAGDAQHWYGCDPVVVDGNYAYVTLRAGHSCGGGNNVLEVYDVSDKSNIQLLQQYTVDNPYGLGLHNDLLFLCDGTAGLKIYDRSGTPTLSLQETFTIPEATDVIPLDDRLILIGGGIVRQYAYSNGSITEMSILDLN